MSDRYRPEGHSGSKDARLSAQRAVLRDHFGPYYLYVQRLGGIPVGYFIVGVFANYGAPWLRLIVIGVGALVYAFMFHIYATSYFAARAKIGLDTCRPGSFGLFWSKIFIARSIVHHIVMLSALIWLGTTWFLASGFILYIIDYIITITSSRLTASPKTAPTTKDSTGSGRSS